MTSYRCCEYWETAESETILFGTGNRTCRWRILFGPLMPPEPLISLNLWDSQRKWRSDWWSHHALHRIQESAFHFRNYCLVVLCPAGSTTGICSRPSTTPIMLLLLDPLQTCNRTKRRWCRAFQLGSRFHDGIGRWHLRNCKSTFCRPGGTNVRKYDGSYLVLSSIPSSQYWTSRTVKGSVFHRGPRNSTQSCRPWRSRGPIS